MLRWLARFFSLFAERGAAVRKPVVEEVEPRILYSADVNPLLWGGVDPNGTAIVAGIDSGGSSTTTPQAVDAQQQQRRREIVFVDAAVVDSQTLVDALIAQRGGSADIEVVQLRADADGLAQIDAVLAGEHGIDALHIVSHGEAGRLQLGNGFVDSATLQERAASLAGWQQALNADADILLFGCNVGEGAAGDAFIGRLAALTGADVAASVDATGATARGGDWDLEVRTGAIETAVNAAAPQWQAWDGRLDITTGLIGRWRFDANANDFSGNNYNGTLANGALIDNTAGTNRIGTGKLFLDGSNDRVDLSAHISNFSSLTQGTISAWIRTSDTLGVIYEVTNTGNSGSYVVLGILGGKLNFEVRQNNTDSLNVTTTASINDNNWHHVAVTVGPSGNTLYIDGVAQAVTYGTGTAATQRFYNNVSGLNVMEIGVNQTSGGSSAQLAALMDDVRFYNRALSSTDMAQLYAFAGPGITVTPVVGLTTTEAGGTAQFSVVLNDAPTATVTIPVSSSDTSEGTVSTTLLTFTTANWNVAQTVTVTGVNDALADGSQGYTAVLAAATSTDANYSGRDAADVQLANSDDDVTYNQISVDTTADTADGDTSSLAALAANRGADGVISLREAITAANNTANGAGGADRIGFAIAVSDPGYAGGVFTISLTSALPQITGALTIDGTTQATNIGNTNAGVLGAGGAVGADSFALSRVERPEIQIVDGNNLALGLDIQSSNVTVRGLSIYGFGGGSNATGNIYIGDGFGNLLIEQNIIGASAASFSDPGAAARSNGSGIVSNGADNAIVRNNLIGFNGYAGVRLNGSSTAWTIENNEIRGNAILGIGDDGIGSSATSAGMTIQRNLLTGNVGNGLDFVTDGGGHTVSNNTISANGSGGNQTFGIALRSSNNTVQANTITGNAGAGITVNNGATGNVISRNSIFSNGAVGIDLQNVADNTLIGTAPYITANDAGDADAGGNGLQNFPALTSANSNSAGTTIVGTINSNANTTYRIEYFANRPTVADATNGEGERYLGFITVTTDGAGNASVNTTLANVWVNSGDRITATATVDLGGGAYGSTSEFAANVTASATGIIVVDTTSDTVDGTTTSITNLGNARGADGRISLREAINAANATANGGTPDRIVFNIPVTDANHFYYRNNGVAGTFATAVTTTLADAQISDFDADYIAGTARSWYRISLSGNYLDVTQAVIIDGSTQAGYSVAGGPVIEINAAGVTTSGDQNAIALTSGASTIRGLVINSAGDNAIEVDVGAGGSTIVGNYLGTDVSGTQALANSTVGTWGAIAIKTTNVIVGGTTAADRNVISGNAGYGVEFYSSASGSTVVGNYIGTTANDAAALGNTAAGVYIRNSSANNTIGGTAAGQGNLIANNGGDGIWVEATAASGNALLGNTIYSNAGQAIDLGADGITANDAGDGDSGPNALQNFPVLSSANSTVTGTTITGSLNSTASTTYRIEFYANRPTVADAANGEGERYLGFVNVTTDGSGNATINTTLTSVWVNGGDRISATATNLTTNNTSEFAANINATSTGIVVVDTVSDVADGTTTNISTLGNARGADGRISLREAIIAANNTANGGTPDKIVFNIAGSGVHTITLSSLLPTISTSMIIDASTDDSFAASGNRPAIVLNGNNTVQDGLRLYAGSDGSTVRGFVIQGFTEDGIDIATSGSNTIAGNWVGLTSAGTAAAGNGNGVNVFGGNNNVIGGTTAADRNVISGNSAAGIWVGGGASANQVIGNYIGTNTAGTAALGNSGAGVAIYSAGNVVGGSGAGSGNVISGNATFGIRVEGSAAVGNSVAGNFIGLNAAGTAMLGNGNDGVFIIDGASGNTVGGTTVAHRNVIAGNSDGVQIGGSAGGSNGNTIQGNYIGTDVTGTLDFGNNDDGIDIDNGALNNQLLGNLISGNSSDGIDLGGAGASTGTVIRGNLIGTQANGTSALGNGGRGILVGNGGTADSTTIGGTTAGQGNTIAFSGGDGIYVAASTSVSILGNAIHSNSGLAIDLGTNGVTANDTGDADTGANNLQNFPLLATAATTGTQITITGSLNSAANSYYRIEFYANTSGDASGNGEGQTYLGFANVGTDAAGNATFSATLTQAVPAGAAVSATATRSDAAFTTFTDTSEFAANVVAFTNAAPVLDASKSPALTAIVEDAGAPVGAVGTLVSSLVDFASPAGQIDNVTDANGGALLGIAVTAADTTNGVWWYSTDGGSSWNALGSPSTASARLLAADSDNRLYFQPNANYNGTLASAITFRAWDRTSGTDGGSADTTTNGGNTAFSSATDSASLTVGAVNDAPVLAGANNLTAITEDPVSNPGTLVSALISGQITDVDAAAASGIAVTAVDNSNGAWWYTTNGGTTWLPFNTPSASAARLLTADANTRIGFVPNANFNGTATITFRAWDQTSGAASATADVTSNGGTSAFSSATATSSITVTAVNDAPVVGTTGTTLAYTENGAATAIDSALTVSDIDSANLASATVTISSNFASGQDTLAFTSQNGITGSWNAGTGVLTLTGSATVANYQAALRSITYINTSDNPSTATRTVSFVVNDGSANSNTGTRNIGVTSVNDAPAGTDKAITINEDATHTFVRADFGFSDVDGNTLQRVWITTLPAQGELRWNGATFAAGNFITATDIDAGQLVYVPATNANGAAAASFTFRVQDDGGTANGGADQDPTPNTISFNITAVNDAPVITSNGGGANAAVGVAENQTAVTTVTSSDVDGGTPGYSIIDGADAALFSINAATGVLTFNSAPNFEAPADAGMNNTYDVTVQVADGNGGNTTQAIAVTVTNVNEAPVNTVPGAQTTSEDTAKVFSSANGNAISIADVDAGGANNEITISVSNGTLTLAGTAGLTFTAGDGTADATMTLRGTASAINAALNGLAYVPTADYNGSATLTLVTTDSDLLTLNIDAALRGRYTFDNAGALGADGSPAAGNVGVVNGATAVVDGTRGNVVSFDGDDVVQIAGRFGNPANVTLAAWVNLTAADTVGAEVISIGDSVALRLEDTGRLMGFVYNGSGFTYTTYNVSLIGAGWHHVAFSFDDSGTQGTLYLDGVAVASTSTTSSIAYTRGANSTIGAHGNGATSVDFTGRIDDARVYNRALTAAEVAALASDQSLTDTDTVAITVTPVNDAPLITSNGGGATAGVTVAENTSAVTTLTTSDVDGGSAIYSIVAGGDGARFTIDAATGALAFIAAPDYEAPTDSDGNNVYDVTVQVADGNGGSDTQAISVTVSDVSSTLVVTTADDSNDTGLGATFTAEQLNANRGADGAISLREAIIAANNTINPYDVITFNIAGGGPQTINVAAALPTITGTVLIDGWSQGGFGGTPLIELTGNYAGSSVEGLTLAAGSDGSTVRGLIINRFTGNGIEIDGSGYHTLQGNWIGLDNTGATAAANVENGIYATASVGNLIGGTTSQERNVISGNGYRGIHFVNVDGSTIAGNYVGTNASGTADVNGAVVNLNQSGIVLATGSDGNLVGGATAAARNVVSGNNHYGVEFQSGSQNNRLEGNYIGTNALGNAAVGNRNGGMALWGAGAGNAIGGGAAGAGNVISGNAIGVLVSNGSSGGVIQGNLIGVAANGISALGNTANGILIDGAATNTLVGTNGDGSNDIGERNVIAANGANGVAIGGAGTTGSVVRGNFIGLGSDGSTALGNGARGVVLTGATGTTIHGNVIGANAGDGIAVIGAGSGVRITGNLVGTDATGLLARGNEDGIVLDNTSGVVIGGSAASDRNVIAGNNGEGIEVYASNNAWIAGNFIGLGADGNTVLANSGGGVLLHSSSNNITIGTNLDGNNDAGEGNVISGNGLHGITLNASSNNAIRGNLIGLDAGGTQDRGNANDGIHLFDSASNTIGGATAAARNVISGNGGYGIVLGGTATTGNVVRGNHIGTNAAGSAAVGNGASGIGLFNGASGNTIGGTAAGAGNVVSGNGDDGIAVADVGTTANTVQGNVVGLNATQTATIGNTNQGIWIGAGASGNTIGGSVAGAGNVVGGNTYAGIELNGSGTSGNVVAGNFIGTDGGGNGSYGNGSGVAIFAGASTNLIGGVLAGAGNLIANNLMHGVVVTGSSSGNAVLRNSMRNNGGLGIDLGWDGVTPNDAGDADSGANDRQNFPTLSGVLSSGGSTTISGTVNSTANTQLRIEFFSAPSGDASGYGEGQTFLGFVDVTTDAAGNATINALFGGTSVTAGHAVTATATVDLGGGNHGSTSEFSAHVTCMNPPVNSVPVAQTVNEDTALVIGGVSVADPDGNLQTVRLTVANGTLGVSLAGGASISAGANASATLTLSGTQAQINASLAAIGYQGVADFNGSDTLTVLSTDALGATDSDTVAITVLAVNDAPSGLPVISGIATEDQTLSADTSSIADADGLGAFSYQWQRDGVSIVGENGSTYTLGDADVGASIRVVVSYTDGNGAVESLTSAAVSPILNVNDAPSGAPIVTGTLTEDQTLSADTSSIADADGLGAFSYQWQRDGVAIAGANASTYMLGDADVGASIRVIVSYTDGNGTPESLTSAAVSPILNVNDAPSGAPIVTGTLTEDQTLSADTSSIADADGLGAFSYQWQRNGVAIAGANASTYTLGDADVGASIRVVVSYIDGNGTVESLTSAAVSPILNVNDAPSGAPAISGIATEDQTLTADTSSVADADGLGTFNYQWQRNGVAIVGANGSTYALGDADVGTIISVVVGYTDGNGTAESLISAPVGPVANVNDAPSGAPAITGTATEDQTLTADTSSIADADGLGAFTYQWQRNGVAITGATGSTYTLGDADVGATISVVVSYTDGDGAVESVTSAAVGPIANANDAPLITSNGGGASVSLSIAENQSVVTTMVSTDVDGAAPIYSITGGADAARFAIDAASGALRFVAAPDFEAPSDADRDNVYELVVSVADGNGGADSQSIAVAVSGVNEAPRNIAPASIALTENARAGTVVAIVTASDPDAGDLLTFTLLNDGAGRFVVDPASGRLLVAPGAVLDFEAGSSHTLILRVTDAQGLRTEQEIVVTLRDLIESPPDILPPDLTPPPAPAPAPAPAAAAPTIAPVVSTAGSERDRNADREPAATPSGRTPINLVGSAEDGGSLWQPQRNRSPGEGGPVLVASVSFAIDGSAAGGWSESVLDGLLMPTSDVSAQRPGLLTLRGFSSIQTDAGDDAMHRAERGSEQDVLAALQDPVRVASATLTAGFVWWLTRSGGLLTSILMGIPAWRHVDLLPVLAPGRDDDEEDDNADADSRHDDGKLTERDSLIDDMFSNTSRMFGESRFLN